MKTPDAVEDGAPPRPLPDREVWTWVNSLIEDVRREEESDAFAQNLGRWDLAVRTFRRAEDEIMYLDDPSEPDRRFCLFLLHTLAAMGNRLLIHSQQFTAQELDRFGVKHGQIEAYVAEVEESLREWSNDADPQKVSDLEAAIFGAKT